VTLNLSSLKESVLHEGIEKKEHQKEKETPKENRKIE
jgi:hypothetical protein